MATTKKNASAEVVETTEAKPRLSRLERLQLELAEAEAKARIKKEEAYAKAREAEAKARTALEKAHARYLAAAETTYLLSIELGYASVPTPEELDEEAKSLAETVTEEAKALTEPAEVEQPELPIEG